MGEAGARLFPPEQWDRIKRVFEEVSQLPRDRHAAAIEAATTDEDVRREVATLLAVHDEAGDFLEPPAAPTLTPGHRLGPYEIVAPLGGGGAGDVYRAQDTRLGRPVAVKVLRAGPTSAAARARFLREARAIAAISHANVVAIFDVGDEAGVPYIVTELLGGETLRARLARGVPTVSEALAWTRQIARGLSAAHDRGIVHRDLKPENVMLLDDGELKLLDFGLARPTTLDGDRDISVPGTILGTVGYLAPEQARGKPTTAAADLFALGAMLFEMLTGRRAFAGESLADTLRAVLDDEPPAPSTVRPEVPAWLDRVVARCLAKDATARFQSARDLAFVLESATDQPVPVNVPAVAPRQRARTWLLAALAVGLGALAAALAVFLVWPRPPPQQQPPPSVAPDGPAVARPIALTQTGRERHPAVSPDGKFLAYVSDRDGTPRIWIQQLISGPERPITDGPDSAPRFSPDSTEVLFTRDRDDGARTLYRVGVLGGEPRKIVDDAGDGDWSPDGTQVVFVRARLIGKEAEQSVVAVNIDGSNERVLAVLGSDRVDRGRDSEQRVRWSPDGKQIALTGRVRNPGGKQHVALIPATGGSMRRIWAATRDGMVSAVAWEDLTTVIYTQATAATGNANSGISRLVRHRLDTGQIDTLWWSLENGVVVDRWPGHGVVMDVRSGRQNLRQIAHDGRYQMLTATTSIDRQPRVTPDRTKVLFTSNRGGGLTDLWLVDRQTRQVMRLTDHPREDYDPSITPDGKRLLWSSNRGGGPFEVWTAAIDGSNPRQITTAGLGAENPTATPDGATIVYAQGDRDSTGVWKIRSDGTDPQRIVANGILPEVSPDGRHVLYVSNVDPRRPTIRVARLSDHQVLPFAIPTVVRGRTSVLAARARWTHDGSAIAFIAQNERGYTGVYRQRFDPDATDTSATREALAGFSQDVEVESFALDRDAVVLAEIGYRNLVLGVEELPR